MAARRLDKILEEAKWVVTLFDQANANGAIENLGRRAKSLKDGVEDLRKAMVDEGIDPHDVGGTWVER